MTLTLTDMFCGAGGSSTGAIQVPGVTVRVASNHWSLAIETHNTNHPDAVHIQADLSTTDPRYFPTSDLLWASPECTNHSRAKGRKTDTLQTSLWDATLPDAAADRSRATMWDVVRFAEVHRYRMVFVENVVEVADWLPFRAWLLAMEALGYQHQTVSLNSMNAQAYGLPAPQSRDRLYIVFHRKGDPRPDFAGRFRPRAYCPGCDTVVNAVQAFKKPGATIGRYRSQYVYRCPNTTCRSSIVEPAWLPAASIIDWSLKGQRIGDRSKPLADKTRRRIAAGIARYWSPLAVPVEGREGKQAQTVTTRDTTALVMRNNTGGAEMVTPAMEVLRTITTSAHQSILTAGDIAAAEAQVDDVLFRMLEPSEAARAMAFPVEYVMLGNRREQVRLAGNAVTPPAARDLIAVGVEALGGAA